MARMSQNQNPPQRRSARIKQAATASIAPVVPAGNKVTSGRIQKAAPKTSIKPKQQRYDCTTCDRNLAASSFPKHLPTDTCSNHLINTCKTCLKQWIEVQLNSTTYDNITCPECPELMQNSDIKLHATKAVFTKFDDLERRAIADKTPGWRWCLAPRCRAGQVHEALLQAASEPVKPTGRTARKSRKLTQAEEEAKIICTCNECGAKACVKCDRPWHEGETCEVYQKRVRYQKTAKEDAASEATIKKQCRACPNCKKNIQRNGGCDHMMCSQCKTRFCWICVRTYDVIGRDGHGPGCTYARPGAIDPHNVGVGPVMAVGALAMGIVGGAGAWLAGGWD